MLERNTYPISDPLLEPHQQFTNPTSESISFCVWEVIWVFTMSDSPLDFPRKFTQPTSEPLALSLGGGHHNPCHSVEACLGGGRFENIRLTRDKGFSQSLPSLCNPPGLHPSFTLVTRGLTRGNLLGGCLNHLHNLPKRVWAHNNAKLSLLSSTMLPISKQPTMS